MNRKESERERSPDAVLKLARGAAVVAAVFSLIVCTLMISTYIRVRASHPLDSTLIDTYVERLRESPEDESLRREIRSLDLLVRRAFFTGLWQIRIGTYLVLGGVAVLLICLKIISVYGREPVIPGARAAASDQEGTSLFTGRLILAGGVLLLAAAGAASFLARSTLEDMETLARQERGSDTAGSDDFGYFWADDTETVENILDDEELVRNWPCFRGPGGNAHAVPGDYPLAWNGVSGEGVLWRTEIPLPGFNSPIVWGNRVFLSGSDGTSQEVYCLDTASGAFLWQGSVDGISGSPAVAPDVSSDTGYAAPTMATDGARVYALFATGDIAAFAYEGNRVWARNLGVPDNHYGHSSSLMVYDDLLLVQYDDMSEPKLLALDTVTGETRWSEPRNVAASWSSPLLVYTGKRPELIVNATPVTASYDPRNGNKLWQIECLMGEVGPSPAYADGMVFAVNQYAILAAISLEARDIVWEAYDGLPDASSPLATEECLFLAASYGVVTCFDAKTGGMLWEQEFEEGFYASPVLAGDRIYLMDRSGGMHIFRADRQYESLGESPLGEPSDSTPALVAGRIYIRGNSHLYCIGK
jgi:outer membrane protein assembly factor BamB